MRSERPLDILTRLTLELRYDAAANRFRRTTDRLARWLKYNPNWQAQPRAPSGTEQGGRWIDGGGGSDSAAARWPTIDDIIRLIPPGLTPSLDECIAICLPLIERPGSGSDKNDWDFQRCLNICRGRGL